MSKPKHGQSNRKPKVVTTLHTDASKFIIAHQKNCNGSFKQVTTRGSTESFSCKLCESSYIKTWRSYNQFKFEGTLIQPVQPNTKPKENATNA